MNSEVPSDPPVAFNDAMFHRMIGRSRAMREVFQQIEAVAQTTSNVLILGETGTGKELVANALHAFSPRRSEPFVKLNCAALQPLLLESELFGHERGAFTGAVARRTGRFELANKGTLFLDEVGELPLELQPKLLRVLEEKEFERVGSSQTLRADVRLVAATHRHLEEMCAARAFREDLFYRLNVFPIYLPPLRHRRDDIPALVRSLLGGIARRLGKDGQILTDDSMRALCEHDWPGNVRELQNVLERAVIRSRGPFLEVRLASRPAPVQTPSDPVTETTGGSLEDVSRAHILAVLRSTNGVISGPQGAAVRLGMKRSTLNFRMKKLGIERRSVPGQPSNVTDIGAARSNRRGLAAIESFEREAAPCGAEWTTGELKTLPDAR